MNEESKEQKYTKEGLSIVSRDTAISLLEVLSRDIRLMGDEATMRTFLKEIYKILQQDNNEVLKFCDELYGLRENVHSKLSESFNNGYKMGIVEGIYYTYELLRRQVIANKLEDEIKSK